MPRATANKLYRTFVKGLITEAGPLTYPENASINEDNCVIYRKGNRSRRKGINYESGFKINSNHVTKTNLNDVYITEHEWLSANNDSSKNFIVTQVGATLYFYDQAVTPLSAGLKPWTVNLNDFSVPGGTPSGNPVQCVTGKGYLFVVGPDIEPFLINYSSDVDGISTQRIYILIRDFKGLDDGLANDEEPASLTAAHQYNLQNQGWIDPNNSGSGNSVVYYTPFGHAALYIHSTTNVITSYYSHYNTYPANNKQWWVAKDSTTGDFDPTLLGKFYFGNQRAPRGHYVVEAMYIDRSAVSGVAGIPVEAQVHRPNTVTFFQGRVWYAMDSTVYFSQTLDDKRKAGFCYMEADPTSEDFSDLVATDGGVIPIPEAIKIVRLVPHQSGVLVFATNGIWFIGGTAGGFTATDISCTKVSPTGTINADSIITVEEKVFWWSKIGVQGISQRMGTFGPIDDKFDRSNLAEQTIQTFYNAISANAKDNVKACYDPSTNTIQWLFRDANMPYRFGYNRVLNLDLTLGAFFPWTFSYDNSSGVVCGVFNTVAAGDNSNPYIRYHTLNSQFSEYYFTFGSVNDTTFQDWGRLSFESFVETGYELLEDAMRDKQALYVFCYFRRTEDAWVASNGDYDLANPSSCRFQVRWDWSSSEVSNKWSSEIEAYRLTRVGFPDSSNLAMDNGFPVVVTKNKIRGNGKAIQFRFSNDKIGSNFDLLGWSVPYSGNTNP